MESVKFCQLHKIGQEETNLKISENTNFHPESQVTINNFAIQEEIGAGSFGTVYKVMKKDTKEIFAMKRLSKKFLIKKNMLKYAVSESKIMKELNHPFILNLFYSFECENYLYLVLEYCPGGDLELLLEAEGLSEFQSQQYLAEIVLGLEYLHNNDIIYRDLKPANILLDVKGHIKLADFGIAKNSNNKDVAAATLIGSPAYISPEILCHEGLTKASDIYSFGIVMHELITGIIPFANFDLDKLFSSIKRSDFEISNDLSPEAKDLILQLVDRNSYNRPSLSDIKNHSFFSNIDWNSLVNKKYSL